MRKDLEIFDLIEQEHQRQLKGMELIASENFVSDEVMQAMGSYLTNKYAEGYPGKRYYGGCQVVDVVENLCIERVRRYSVHAGLTCSHTLAHRLTKLFLLLFSNRATPLWDSTLTTAGTFHTVAQ